MEKKIVLVLHLILATILWSCNEKKLIEVVEVPLPEVQEKVTIGKPEDVIANDGSFQVEKLAYAYDALQPSISAVTLETHYAKHYLSYTNNLNKAIVGTPLENLTIEEVLAQLDVNVPEIKNNAGGYYNHSLYFKCLGSEKVEEPKDSLAGSINKKFGSFDNFKTAFKEEANKQFGSAWTWLVVDKKGELQICSTQNQDNPLMRNAIVKGKPILAIDLWEHAFYLDQQNKRKNYIDSFFDIVNWKKVGENFDEAIK